MRTAGLGRFARAVAVACVACAEGGAHVPALAAGPLPAAVQDALDRAGVPREALVAVVQPVDAAAPRLLWQPDRPVNPASLMKLVTSYAALELLGPAWTWTTRVWLDGPVTDGVLDGRLAIRADGDPKLVVERLWLLLRRVRQLGVDEIRGDIVLDRSAFAPAARDPAAFDGEGLRPYNVQPDALLLNFRSIALTFTPDPAHGVAAVGAEPPLAGVRIDATVPLADGPCGDWRAALRADLADPSVIRFAGRYPAACGERPWSIAYADPATYDARLLRGLWLAVGGRLGGLVRDGAAPTGPPTFELRSAPLAETVRDIDKYSNNVMAEQLFLTLGRERGGSGSPEAARTVVGAWAARRFGPAADALVVDNGSGLSRAGRVSARLLARLLQAAWAGPWMPELLGSLPIAGVDGTLRERAAVRGRAHLKTGSLRDVSGVAGIVLGCSGRRQVVVAIVEGEVAAAAARPVLDALLEWAAVDAAPRAGRCAADFAAP